MTSATRSELDTTNSSSKNSEWIVLTVVTFLIFFVQASWAVVNAFGPSVFLDELMYKIDATAIFNLSRYPSTQYPPAYPLVLAPAMLFSNWYEGMLVINALLCSLIVPASWLLARSVGLRHALLAAMLTALLPMQAIYPHYILSENLFVPLFIFSVALALRDGSKHQYLAALFFGFILGLTHLTKYLFLPAVPLLMGVWLLVHFKDGQTQSNFPRRIATSFLLFICILVTYSLTFGAWIYYGRTSGFAWDQLFGLGHSGIKSDAANFDSLLMWATAYLSYVALAWCPVWALLTAWIIQLRDKRWRYQVKSKHWRFLTLVALLVAGYWLVATQHSFGVAYNYPVPQYLLGRYVMHLSPLMVILGVWVLEQFAERPGPLRLKSGLVFAGITCGFTLLAWWILFRQIIWPFPTWFAQINVNSIDVLALSHPLVCAALLVASLLPLLLMNFRKITVRWLVLPLAALMLTSLSSNMLRMRGPQSSVHSREAAVAISKLDKTQDEPVHIFVDNKHLSLSAFEQGLHFWGLSNDQFSAQVISSKTYPDFTSPTLLMTTNTLDAPILHTYDAERELIYHVYQIEANKSYVVRPKILNFGPKTVEAGRGFNIQSSGNSGMWLKIENASPRTYLTIDDEKLNLTFGKDGVVSTTIPKELTIAPRTALLQLHDPDTDQISDAVSFEILPNEIP